MTEKRRVEDGLEGAFDLLAIDEEWNLDGADLGDDTGANAVYAKRLFERHQAGEEPLVIADVKLRAGVEDELVVLGRVSLGVLDDESLIDVGDLCVVGCGL